MSGYDKALWYVWKVAVNIAIRPIGSRMYFIRGKKVMRTFTRLRKMLAGHEELRRKIEEMEGRFNEPFRMVFAAIGSLLEADDAPRKKIGFTAKEAQAKYGVETMEKFTPQTKRRWEAIPAGMRLRIMNNVWCVNCTTTVGIGEVSGRIKKGMLVLEGRCSRCGGTVARVVEND